MKRFLMRLSPFLGLALCCAYMVSEGQNAHALFNSFDAICIEMTHLDRNFTV